MQFLCSVRPSIHSFQDGLFSAVVPPMRVIEMFRRLHLNFFAKCRFKIVCTPKCQRGAVLFIFRDQPLATSYRIYLPFPLQVDDSRHLILLRNNEVASLCNSPYALDDLSALSGILAQQQVHLNLSLAPDWSLMKEKLVLNL